MSEVVQQAAGVDPAAFNEAIQEARKDPDFFSCTFSTEHLELPSVLREKSALYRKFYERGA